MIIFLNDKSIFALLGAFEKFPSKFVIGFLGWTWLMYENRKDPSRVL